MGLKFICKLCNKEYETGHPSIMIGHLMSKHQVSDPQIANNSVDVVWID